MAAAHNVRHLQVRPIPRLHPQPACMCGGRNMASVGPHSATVPLAALNTVCRCATARAPYRAVCLLPASPLVTCTYLMGSALLMLLPAYRAMRSVTTASRGSVYVTSTSCAEEVPGEGNCSSSGLSCAHTTLPATRHVSNRRLRLAAAIPPTRFWRVVREASPLLRCCSFPQANTVRVISLRGDVVGRFLCHLLRRP